jgi:hypothetical protein
VDQSADHINPLYRLLNGGGSSTLIPRKPRRQPCAGKDSPASEQRAPARSGTATSITAAARCAWDVKFTPKSPADSDGCLERRDHRAGAIGLVLTGQSVLLRPNGRDQSLAIILEGGDAESAK